MRLNARVSQADACLLPVSVLLVNAIAILSEDRFLARSTHFSDTHLYQSTRDWQETCSWLGIGTTGARIRWPGRQHQCQVKSHQPDRISPHPDEEYVSHNSRFPVAMPLTQGLTVPLIVINTLIIVYELILGWARLQEVPLERPTNRHART